jgi:hypothetical protein
MRSCRSALSSLCCRASRYTGLAVQVRTQPACLVVAAACMQVLFCVLRGETAYVVDRKVVYCGPRAGSQLTGRAALPWAEKALLVGPSALPWREAAGLLEAGDAAPAAEPPAAEAPAREAPAA